MSSSEQSRQSNRRSHRSHPREKARGIKNYGCWKGTPTSFTAQTLTQDRSPHIYLKFSDGSGSTKEAAINVASTDSDHDLVYWLHRTWSHPVTKTLTSLDSGFHEATTTDGTDLSLDFLRTTPALLDLTQGRVLPNNEAGANNDILDQLKPLLDDAIGARATVYIFGSNYGTGIDDVHMNQGSEPQYDNAVGEDGALIFHYADDNHFEAVFLAFASQSVPTDDQTGAAESNGTRLDQIATGGQSTDTF